MLESVKDKEYKDFLLETRRNIALCHGGYFARDWGEKDDSSVSDEVADILHKERTLSFKREDDKWNIRRFFFSKWTLREGWDNPNVFTICKLRSSGSETSKVQEVGRGLRLPVDEAGMKVHSPQWRLNLVVGYDEKDFAASLVSEINESAQVKLNHERLTDSMLERVCTAWGKKPNEVLKRFMTEEKIIDFDRQFITDGYEKLIKECPQLFDSQLNSGKVINAKDANKDKYIYLRRNNWEAVRALWTAASKRYMITLCRAHLNDKDIKSVFMQILSSKDIFNCNSYVTVDRQSTGKGDGGTVALFHSGGTVSNTPLAGQMQYGAFIKAISEHTCIPLFIVHECVRKALQELSHSGAGHCEINKMINRNTLSNIISKWSCAFENMATSYTYKPLDFSATVSVLHDGEFADKIARGMVGRFTLQDIEDDKRLLYDMPLSYDSEVPEHAIMRFGCKGYAKVIAFGKLPRKAIKVPVITGGTTTPDFIYAVNTGGENVLYILVESKSSDMRDEEKINTKAQEEFFKRISSAPLNVEWVIATKTEDVIKVLEKLAPPD